MPAAAAAAAAALLLLALLAALGWLSWQSARVAKLHEMQLHAESSANGLDRYLQEVRAALVLLGQRTREGGGVADIKRAHALLRQFQAAHSDFQSVLLVRPDGQILASSQSGPLRGLPSLAAQRSLEPVGGESDLEPLVLRRVIWGPVVKRWVVPMRHALLAEDGRPLAYLIATLPVEIIEQFISRQSLPARGVAVLMRDDGYVLSRTSGADAEATSDTYTRPRNGVVLRYLQAQAMIVSGTFEGMNSMGNSAISGGYARLASFPLTAGIYLPQDEVRRLWLEQLRYPLLAFALFFLAMVVVYRVYLKQQWLQEGRRLAMTRELEGLVAERTAELRAIRGRLEKAENEERRQLARDLHDELGQTLAALRIRLSQIENAEGGVVRAVWTKMVELVNQADASTRHLATRLVPTTLHTLGFSSALQSLCEELERDFDLVVTLDHKKLGIPLDHNVRDVLYRAVRELLINVAKHAGVRKARLVRRLDGGDILLQVIDEGGGFAPDAPAVLKAPGAGIAGMRERLLFIGATLTISSAPGAGTTAEIRLPLTLALLTAEENAS